MVGHFSFVSFVSDVRRRSRASTDSVQIPGAALLLELRAGLGLRVHAVVELFPLLAAGGSGGLLEAQVRTAGSAQQLGAAHHGGLPVEDHAVLLRPDQHGVARLRADPEQLVLDAQLGEAVREVAHGLVVVEVRLQHPALGLLAPHVVQRLLGAVLAGDHELVAVLATTTPRGLGLQHRHGATPLLALLLLGPCLETRRAIAKLSSRRPSWEAVEISNTG